MLARSTVCRAILFTVLSSQMILVSVGQDQSDSPWTADPKVVDANTKKRTEFNYIESKVPQYTLPDPLALATPDGPQQVTDTQTWMEKRRPQLLQLFREHVYGIRPSKNYEITYEEIAQDDNLFGIGAKGRQVRATIQKGAKSHSFEFVVATPKTDKPVPVIVLINNRYLIPLDKVASEHDPFWPVEMITRSGFATASFCTKDVDPDEKGRYADGIRALLDDPASAPETRWKSLSAWGWGASRVLDYALTLDEVSQDQAAVIGHSRGGKTALWAAAEDPRFKIAYSNESGCGGAALSRRAYGETVKRINTSFPYWFCDNFSNYNDRESDLPVDQHELIALIAPRAAYVASADLDLWADPRGEYSSLLAAGPVFKLFGLDHITKPEMPPLDQPRQVGSMGYHVRSGKHNLTEQDWGYYLEFAKKQF